MNLLTLSLIVSSPLLTNVHAIISPDECEALQDLYHSTGGENYWKEKWSFGTAEPCQKVCTWSRVVCTRNEAHITRL